MATIDNVIREWAWSNHAGCTNLVTDGERLWSYRELIAFTSDTGRKIVIQKTAKASGGFVSVTTSRHVNAAFKMAQKCGYRCDPIMMHPTVFDSLGIERKLSYRPAVEINRKPVNNSALPLV